MAMQQGRLSSCILQGPGIDPHQLIGKSFMFKSENQAFTLHSANQSMTSAHWQKLSSHTFLSTSSFRSNCAKPMHPHQHEQADYFQAADTCIWPALKIILFGTIGVLYSCASLSVAQNHYHRTVIVSFMMIPQQLCFIFALSTLCPHPLFRCQQWSSE